MASADEVKRRTNRIAFSSIIGAGVLVIANFLPTDPEPLLWIKMALMIAAVIVMVGLLTRLCCGSGPSTGANAAKTPSTRSILPLQTKFNQRANLRAARQRRAMR